MSRHESRSRPPLRPLAPWELALLVWVVLRPEGRFWAALGALLALLGWPFAVLLDLTTWIWADCEPELEEEDRDPPEPR